MKKYLIALVLVAFSAAVQAMPGERWIFDGDSIQSAVFTAGTPDTRKLTALAVPQTINISVQNVSSPGATMTPTVPAYGWDAHTNRATLKKIDGYFGAKGVVIMLGTNDWGNPSITTGAFHDAYKSYVQYAKAQGLEVVCVAPLWRSDEASYLSSGSAGTFQMWVYAWIIETVCGNEGVHYINGRNAPLLPEHFHDGLHLNAAGHEVFTSWLITQMQMRGFWTDTYGTPVAARTITVVKKK